MSSFNEDFKNLIDAFHKAGLGNSSLPTFAAGDDYKIETVTEIVLMRINNAIQNCSDPEKKKLLQSVAAKATTPYFTHGHNALSADMKKSLNKIYGTDNLVFIPQNAAFQEALSQPKSTWNDDFGSLRAEFSTLVHHSFPNPGNGDYGLDTQFHLLLARLHDGKSTMRDSEKADRIKVLAAKAVELYLHKSGKTTAQLPNDMKKQMTEILGKDAKIVSNTPEKQMKFDVAACIVKEPKAPTPEKKPSLWSRFKSKTKKFLSKPAVKAVGYTALAAGFGAAAVGITAAAGTVAAGAYGAATLGNAMLLGLAVTTAGCGTSLYVAGRKLKQAWQERREARLQKANFAAKREKVILTFRDKVKKLQQDGNMASAVFEIMKLDNQLKPLTAEEHKEMGKKDKQVSGLKSQEYDWVKNFYPGEFHPLLANTLKFSRLGEKESEIQAKIAPMMEKAKHDYAVRLENEKNAKPKSRRTPQKQRDMHRLSREYRKQASRIG